MEVSGTHYDDRTPKELVDLLEDARINRHHVRVFYGDTTTGEDWLESFASVGRISRSMGRIKVPIMLQRSNSYGGPAILTHCIVRLLVNDVEVYRHENYIQPALFINPGTTTADGILYKAEVYKIDRFYRSQLVARFKSIGEASRWIDFMLGKRRTPAWCGPKGPTGPRGPKRGILHQRGAKKVRG